jgi:hypothetical protein
VGVSRIDCQCSQFFAVEPAVAQTRSPCIGDLEATGFDSIHA